MTDSARLERGYRRLLACYPQPFRREQADEVLAVLMAGAQPGQRRPGLAEAADVLKSALRMRLRPARCGPGDGAWSDGLALFSVAAPLLVLAVAVLEVALPYRPPQTPQVTRALGSNFQIGGLSLLHFSGFLVALGGLAVIAALVLLGLRRLALAAITASAVYWWVASYWIPYPLQLLCTSVFMLEVAALIASPGPRRGRALLTRGQGAVVLLAAAAVQASTLLYEAASPPMPFLAPGSSATVYLVTSVVLAVAAAGLAVAVKMNRYFLLLLAAMFYPYVMEVAFPATSTDSDLIGHPTPAHLAVLFLPPLLTACAVLLTAVTPPRYRVVFRAPDPGKPPLT
jgi:hypothetical protein